MSHLFATHDLAAIALDRGDVPRLQALFVRCTEFIELVHRRPAGPHEAEELFDTLPPGKTVEDKFVLGLETATGDLAGVVEFVRNFPGEDEWYLGLLLLDPAQRGGGAGGRVMDALEAWLLVEGAQALYLAVQEQNEGALRFWERRGYSQVHEAEGDTGRIFRLMKKLG